MLGNNDDRMIVARGMHVRQSFVEELSDTTRVVGSGELLVEPASLVECVYKALSQPRISWSGLEMSASPRNAFFTLASPVSKPQHQQTKLRSHKNVEHDFAHRLNVADIDLLLSEVLALGIWLGCHAMHLVKRPTLRWHWWPVKASSVPNQRKEG